MTKNSQLLGTLSLIGWLPVFAPSKSGHANKIWLSLGSSLKIGTSIFVTKPWQVTRNLLNLTRKKYCLPLFSTINQMNTKFFIYTLACSDFGKLIS
jgi:hypothetical protein